LTIQQGTALICLQIYCKYLSINHLYLTNPPGDEPECKDFGGFVLACSLTCLPRQKAFDPGLRIR
jgi:hypothetical protein